MEIKKVSWSNSDNHVRFTLPMTKVNEEKREVSGFASLDNTDEHDDVVLADASSRAFSRFRGNIREMHQPIAVGKMVDFTEDEYFDKKSGKTYKGIYVTVKVSKGAQDTWEKVLDGTLTGFSIGGNIIEAEQTILKSDGRDRSIRLIKDYELEELSLVDNPANQLANVFSIQKTKDGQEVTGMIVAKNSEVVYYCKEDTITKTSTEDSANCPVCGSAMNEAGWIEYTDVEDKIAKIADCLKSFSTEEGETSENTDEGGVEMSKQKVEKTVTNPESEESNIDPVEQGKAETEVESSVEEVSEVESAPSEEEEVSEVEPEGDELHKMLVSLREDLKGDLNKNFGDLEEKITAVNKSFDEFGEKINDRFVEFETKHSELVKKIATLKDDLDSVEKSIGTLTKSTARKDSVDLGGSSDAITKSVDSTGSLWRGTFLSTDYLD
jgi:hypothetical protein